MATGLYFYGRLDDMSIMLTKCIMTTLTEALDIIIIDPFVGNKLHNVIPDCGCKFVKYNVNHLETWNEIHEYNCELLKQNNIDTVISFKQILSKGFRHNENETLKGLMRKMKEKDSTVSFNFNQTKIMLQRFALIEAASQVCDNVYEFILDPQELCFDEVLEFNNFKRLYIMQRDEYTYMPCFEYGAVKLSTKQDKVNDFIFYCGAVTEDRKYIADIADKIESIKGWDVQVNTSKRKDIRPLPQDKYHIKLSQSRYTLIIPAYDITAFSMCRLVEAIANDCLCFVHHTTCLKDLQFTFPDIYDIVKEELIVNNFKEIKKKIKETSEEKRLDIINQIKSTKSWKRFTDIEYVTNRWCKLKGVYKNESRL